MAIKPLYMHRKLAQNAAKTGEKRKISLLIGP
jgi:hypothetical protein